MYRYLPDPEKAYRSVPRVSFLAVALDNRENRVPVYERKPENKESVAELSGKFRQCPSR